MIQQRGKPQGSVRKCNWSAIIYISGSGKPCLKERTLCREPGKQQRGKQAAETACAKALRQESEWPMQQGGQGKKKFKGHGSAAYYVGFSKPQQELWILS